MSEKKQYLYLGGPHDGIDGRLKWYTAQQDLAENKPLLGESGQYEEREPRLIDGQWTEVREWVRDPNPPMPHKEPEIDGTRD